VIEWGWLDERVCWDWSTEIFDFDGEMCGMRRIVDMDVVVVEVVEKVERESVKWFDFDENEMWNEKKVHLEGRNENVKRMDEERSELELGRENEVGWMRMDEKENEPEKMEENEVGGMVGGMVVGLEKMEENDMVGGMKKEMRDETWSCLEMRTD
jgi:hypothetical protein